MILVAIDPGKHRSGVAIFQRGVLIRSLLSPPSRDILSEVSPTAGVLVVEKPQVYDRSISKGDPNDLIDIAIVVGMWVGLIPTTLLYTPTPAQWKGQVPKEIHNGRVLRTLTAAELSVLGKKDHNKIDAIGLGKWVLSL